MKGFLQEIHPVLPVKDIKTALIFYTQQLGFDIAFADNHTNPFYAGIKRDNVEIHLQWHDSKEWETIDRPMLRFVTKNIESLFEEYKAKGVFHRQTCLKETDWGTREFAFFDLYKNGLTFYEDL